MKYFSPNKLYQIMGDLIKYGGTNDVKILFFIFSFFNLLTLDYLFLGVCQIKFYKQVFFLFSFCKKYLLVYGFGIWMH